MGLKKKQTVKAKRPPGRPPYKASEADRVFVERAVMAGTTINDIADMMKITDDTLRKYYMYEIMTGRERMKGDAVRVIMDSLQDGSLDAAKFVLARVAGWTEKTDVNNTGSMTINFKTVYEDE